MIKDSIIYNYAYSGVLLRIAEEERKLNLVKNNKAKAQIKARILKMKFHAEYIRHKM